MSANNFYEGKLEQYRAVEEDFRRKESDGGFLRLKKFLPSPKNVTLETLKNSRSPLFIMDEYSKLKHEAVDVIIPVYGESPMLQKCIEAVNDCDVSTRVTIVDNGTPSGTLDFLDDSVAVIRNEDNKGYGGGCDQGIAATASDVVVLLNSDALVAPETISQLADLILENEKVAVACATCVDETGNLAEHGRYIRHNGHSFPYGENDTITDPRFLSTLCAPYASFVCVALSRRIYKEMGGFDEEFFPAYYEDTDLVMRCIVQGYDVVVAPSQITHAGAQSADELDNVQSIREKNRMKFYDRYKESCLLADEKLEPASYPFELELEMHKRYESRRLIISTSLGESVLHNLPADPLKNFCAILCFEAHPETLERLRTQGYEVTVGFDNEQHYWMRERIGLYESVIFADPNVHKHLGDLISVTQPHAEVTSIV